MIKKNLNIEANIIPDVLRFKSYRSLQTINYPYKISWFGMPNNFDTLILGIKQILRSSLKCKIKIISRGMKNLKKDLDKFFNNDLTFEFIEWTESVDKDVIKSDIVILPYIRDNQRLVKSSNRIIDSLNLGRFVIMSDAEQFSEFKNYCYFGDIGKGLEWLKDNKKLAIEMTSEGQKYVQKKYSIKVISEI